jgi:transmembrane sensor
MSSFPPPSESLADEQASLWAARLEGGALKPDNRRALEAWLAEAPAHRTLLSQYCQFSADLEIQLADLRTRAPRARAARPALRWIAPALLAAAAAVALVVWLRRPATQIETVATPAGQRQTYTLSDGTRVELNARTQLRVELSGAERHVRLADGEAFFQVSKDKTRPFTVETPAGSVRVTGTTFDVRSNSVSDLEVTVVEGNVQVRPGHAGASPLYLLGAGDRLSSREEQVSRGTLSADALDDALAWRRGEIVLDGVPLREALAAFGRYHGITITADREAGSKVWGGRLSLDDLDGFFATLEKNAGVRVAHLPDGTVHVSLAPLP